MSNLTVVETFGEPTKRLREEKIALDLMGHPILMTQGMLANECNCSVGTISRIERDVQKTYTTGHLALAGVFGTTVEELLKNL